MLPGDDPDVERSAATALAAVASSPDGVLGRRLGIGSLFGGAGGGARHAQAPALGGGDDDDGAAECWFLTAPGLSCVEACGSRPATDVGALYARASSVQVVGALSSLYGLGGADPSSSAQSVGRPCGKPPPYDDGVGYWLSRLVPLPGARGWVALYAFSEADAA